jgi:hypothetical protein
MHVKTPKSCIRSAHFPFPCSAIGLVLTIASFVVGLKHFSIITTDEVSSYRKAYAILGIIAVAVTILQLLLVADYLRVQIRDSDVP